MLLTLRARRALGRRLRALRSALSPERRTGEIDRRRMRELFSFTETAPGADPPTAYGAAVVDPATGRVVARARNRVASTGDLAAHAELLAIREACRELGAFDLPALTLYTTCEPCAMCMGAALWARIGRVVYGFTLEDSAEFFPEVLLPARSIAARAPFRCVVVGPVERAEGRNLLRRLAGPDVKPAAPR